MRNFIKTFDLLSFQINKKTSQLSDDRRIDEEKFDKLEEQCSLFDKIKQEYKGKRCLVRVNEDLSTELSFETLCFAGYSDDSFCELIKYTAKFGFTPTHDGYFKVYFTIPSICRETQN